jgi:protein involved in polysaccharide export with SLBB domain
VLAVLTLLTVGCSSGPNNSFLFPQGHRLTDQARAVRQPVPPAEIPRELDKRVAPPYVVEPGDVLLVHAVNLDSPVRLPGDQPVLPDGTIQLGVYGSLLVAGRTTAEIETEVNQRIRAQTKDAGPVTVRLVTRDSKVYYVLGEVNAPGAFPLKGRETVLDGIVAAGGLTQGASRRNIILSRPTQPNSCRVVLPVCYANIVQLGDTTTNYQLEAGDRIYVPTRTICEQLFHSQGETPACCGPQAPCPAPECLKLGTPGPYDHWPTATLLPASPIGPGPANSGQRQTLPVPRADDKAAGKDPRTGSETGDRPGP